MNLELNDILISLTYALDFIEIDVLGSPTNHTKRVAYLNAHMGRVLGLSDKEIADLLALSILHDNGASQCMNRGEVDGSRLQYYEKMRNHCIYGERNLQHFPFYTDVKNVILYHHEGHKKNHFFNVSEEEIPLMSKLIHFADQLDTTFNLKNVTYLDKLEIKEYVINNKGILFSEMIVDAFLTIFNKEYIWLDLRDEYICQALERGMPKRIKPLSWREINQISEIYSNIIDGKSSFTKEHSRLLAKKVNLICKGYGYESEERYKMIIAAHLHDIGKLAISNRILLKDSQLTNIELNEIKKHTYYTRVCLERIRGASDITEWASNHHEKLDGSGYPFGFNNNQLDFNSRLMACMDMYQALTEQRPYRHGLNHQQAMNILKHEARHGKIDKKIVQDIDDLFHN